ncbi:MAG: hypothetical protein ACE5I7_20840 [Candidatus Binatia bacterium]
MPANAGIQVGGRAGWPSDEVHPIAVGANDGTAFHPATDHMVEGAVEIDTGSSAEHYDTSVSP